MTAIRTIEGDFVAAQGRYALVVGRFNSFVVESLVDGAVDTLKRHGVKESDITIVRVPGACWPISWPRWAAPGMR